MTNTTTISRTRTALVATLLLAAAPFAFGGKPSMPAAGEIQTIGHVVVTAPRLNPSIRSIADLGTMTVTAHRDVLVADLGSMTVTAKTVTLADLGSMTVSAPRAVALANLGEMTVEARRIVVVARNEASPATLAPF